MTNVLNFLQHLIDCFTHYFKHQVTLRKLYRRHSILLQLNSADTWNTFPTEHEFSPQKGRAEKFNETCTVSVRRCEKLTTKRVVDIGAAFAHFNSLLFSFIRALI